MLQILQSYKSGELWLAEVPAPLCKNGGVVVRTSHSFVSAGTERMLVDFARKNIVGKAFAMPEQVKTVVRKMKTEGVAATVEKVRSKLDQPIPLGYSCAGYVEEVGSYVSGIRVGDRVACGGAGHANHAQYNHVPRNLLVKIPEKVSFEDASSATVGSIALQGVRQCDLRIGERVCVIGLGLLGLLAVQLLKASGVGVVGFDPNEERCSLARDLGADEAVSENPAVHCEHLSHGRGMDAALITAATKSDEPVRLAGEICRHRGTVVVTGMVGMDIPRDAYYKKELDFKLSLSYGPGRYDPSYEEAGNDYPYGYVRWTEQRNIAAFLDLVAQGKVTPSKLVTHRFAFADALEAYEIMSGKKHEPYLGIVLDYGAQQPPTEKPPRTLHFGRARIVDGATGVGLIGAGTFAKGVMLPELRNAKGIRLKGIATATGMNAAETGRKEGFEYATTDYRKILQDSDIHTVFVMTRHNTHAKFVCEALEAGKHVFVEKPLALDRKQLAAIERALQEHPSQLMVGFNRRFSPHASLIKRYFSRRSGPLMAHYRVNAGKIPSDSWIVDPAIGGGRIIGEVCHFVDFLCFVIGALPARVHTTATTRANSGSVSEEDVSIALDFEDGSTGTILFTANGPANLSKEMCEVLGDESVAVLDNFTRTRCFGRLGKESCSGKQQKGFTPELDAFFAAVKGHARAAISARELFAVTAATFAAVDSLRSKAPVSVDL